MQNAEPSASHPGRAHLHSQKLLTALLSAFLILPGTAHAIAGASGEFPLQPNDERLEPVPGFVIAPERQMVSAETGWTSYRLVVDNTSQARQVRLDLEVGNWSFSCTGGYSWRLGRASGRWTVPTGTSRLELPVYHARGIGSHKLTLTLDEGAFPIKWGFGGWRWPALLAVGPRAGEPASGAAPALLGSFTGTTEAKPDPRWSGQFDYLYNAYLERGAAAAEALAAPRTPDTLPRHWRDYLGVDAPLVLDARVVAQLSVAQREAISRWVRYGGGRLWLHGPEAPAAAARLRLPLEGARGRRLIGEARWLDDESLRRVPRFMALQARDAGLLADDDALRKLEAKTIAIPAQDREPPWSVAALFRTGTGWGEWDASRFSNWPPEPHRVTDRDRLEQAWHLLVEDRLKPPPASISRDAPDWVRFQPLLSDLHRRTSGALLPAAVALALFAGPLPVLVLRLRRRSESFATLGAAAGLIGAIVLIGVDRGGEPAVAERALLLHDPDAREGALFQARAIVTSRPLALSYPLETAVASFAESRPRFDGIADGLDHFSEPVFQTRWADRQHLEGGFVRAGMPAGLVTITPTRLAHRLIVHADTGVPEVENGLATTLKRVIVRVRADGETWRLYQALDIAVGGRATLSPASAIDESLQEELERWGMTDLAWTVVAETEPPALEDGGLEAPVRDGRYVYVEVPTGVGLPGGRDGR